MRSRKSGGASDMLTLKTWYWTRLPGMMVIGSLAVGPTTSRAVAQNTSPVTVTVPVVVPAGPVVIVGGNRALTLSERLVWPHLRAQVRAIGSRLVAKGNERAIMVGSIDRGSTNSPIRVVSEIAGNLRWEEQSGGTTRVLGTDTQRVFAGTGSLALIDTDL